MGGGEQTSDWVLLIHPAVGFHLLNDDALTDKIIPLMCLVLTIPELGRSGIGYNEFIFLPPLLVREKQSFFFLYTVQIQKQNQFS